MAAATATDGTRRERVPREVSAALNVLLTDAVSGSRQRFFPARPILRLGGAFASRPGHVVRRLGKLGRDVARVAAGEDDIEPDRADRRSPIPLGSRAGCFGA
jgi:polyhydroxyalkanoate synthase